jgi:SAM-dependent methyltransferase
MYGLDVKTQWEDILKIHCIKLAKELHPEWYRWALTNNYERAVFLKGDLVLPRESTRYMWANQNLLGKKVFELGCSSGYGCQFLPNDTEYLGLDYDPIIISVAQEQNWLEKAQFVQGDINHVALDHYDTIIAFEVIEHLDNGLEIVEELKNHCDRLLITVPWNEPVGFWGPHHKIHGLNESHFQGFKFNYIDQHGRVTDTVNPISPENQCNLMILRWDRG